MTAWPVAAASGSPPPLRVSAAISLAEPLAAVAQQFERQTGARVELNLGGTGQLLAQIRQGGAVDVFISAAHEPMDELEAAGLIDRGTRRVVARNRLVLITPPGNPASLEGFHDLSNETVKRLAIGEPRTVPAGQYAMQVLDALGLAEALASRLIHAANVRQVLAYVQRGEVDAGIVYHTDALGANVRVVAIAEERWHRPIEYPAAIIKTSSHDLAGAFVEYLLRPEVQQWLPGGAGGPPAARSDSAHDLWSALFQSLRVALAATLVVAAVGVPLAFFFARHTFPGQSWLEALLTVPLVLPPTVVGYVLVMLLGSHGAVGRWLSGGLLFHWAGAVVAASVVALPLLFLPAKAAFSGVDRELVDIARLMGANPWQVFWHVSLPLARRGIGSGLLLAFARALGEFGATIMVLGDIPGRRTLPIFIYSDYVSGDLSRLTAVAVMLLSGIALAVIFLHNRSEGGRR